MPFRVVRAPVYGTYPAVKILTAGSSDVAVRLTTGSSRDVSISGATMVSGQDGFPSGALDEWITVAAADELWAIRDAPGDVVVTMLVRSTP